MTGNTARVSSMPLGFRLRAGPTTKCSLLRQLSVRSDTSISLGNAASSIRDVTLTSWPTKPYFDRARTQYYRLRLSCVECNRHLDLREAVHTVVVVYFVHGCLHGNGAVTARSA